MAQSGRAFRAGEPLTETIDYRVRNVEIGATKLRHSGFEIEHASPVRGTESTERARHMQVTVFCFVATVVFIDQEPVCMDGDG
jgi:hypothetical protein